MPWLDPEAKRRYDKQYHLDHAEALNSRALRYYLDNKEHLDLRSSRAHFELKLKIFTAYGVLCPLCGERMPKCVLCNESRIGALQIDHILGGGKQHCKRLKKSGDTLYRWLCRQKSEIGNWPSEYRTLCSNCNWKEYLRNSPLSMTENAIKRREMKRIVLTILGHGICACAICGCADLDLLTIEHPNNDGADHRREISNNKPGDTFYRALIKLNDFTSRLMMCYCRSCNDNAAFGRELN